MGEGGAHFDDVGVELKAEGEGAVVDAALEKRSIDVGADVEVSGLHLGYCFDGFVHSGVFAEGRDVGE